MVRLAVYVDMSPSPRAIRSIPHPLWAAGGHATVSDFATTESAQIVVSTDALELLLEETDLDGSVLAKHFMLLDAPVCYYAFGESTALRDWTHGVSRAAGPLRIEGAYVRHSKVDAFQFDPDKRRRFGLLPEACELIELLVVDAVGGSRAHRLHAVTLAIQNPDEELHVLIRRQIEANLSVVKRIGEDRFDGMLRHLIKLSLYLSGDPEVRHVEPLRAPRGSVLPQLPPPVPMMVIGPTAIERLLTPMTFHDQGVAEWMRGRMSASELAPDGAFTLRWLHPALQRRPLD